MTKREEEIQNYVEREAEAWRKKGKNCESGYHRIWVDDTCLIWDELKGEFQLKKEPVIQKISTFRDRAERRDSC